MTDPNRGDGILIALAVFLVFLLAVRLRSHLALLLPRTELDTAFHRLGVLVAGIGALAMGIGVLLYLSSSYRRSIEDLFFASSGWRDWDATLSRIGAILVVVGWVFVYHFGKTIGRLWKWVATGS